MPRLAGVIGAPHPAVRRADVDACAARRHGDGWGPAAGGRLYAALPLAQDGRTDRNPVVARRRNGRLETYPVLRGCAWRQFSAPPGPEPLQSSFALLGRT